MVRSVHLANEAKRRFVLERGDTEIRVGLSLGPFGAILSPTQEFQGCYPPPYGPKSYSPSQENINSFEKDEEAEEERAVEALARFHFERLVVFASKPEVWEGIDCLAFETVPLAREVLGIRRALTMLEEGELGAVKMKPSWISFVFPDGRFPETDEPQGPSLTVRQVVRSALGHGDERRRYRVPDAIGINCTGLEFLPGLLVQLEEAIESVCMDRISKPWLVIYPNGGDVYDSIARKWIAAERPMEGRKWAEDLGRVVQRAVEVKVWGGVIVGGCCRTGPSEVEEIARLMVERFGTGGMT
jgi:homocysteine S-methyltransferase